ncbi:MAG: hypothetical protein C7B46_09045 [Sulfobacillus benefaciens]|uniref:Uncharacterized protein n=1 Tax=Sulfobacillus benefaciens TaxID=453960 RepID=A0A2T2XGY1_9FIRM|nr:MAG: hypothetical protein C7B46_09045 [Sulfobacillus benefaciens]
MGFGPQTPDAASGAEAVVNIVSILYPEHATLACQAVLRALALAILEAKAPLSFEAMSRFLTDPQWREEILSRGTHPSDVWNPWRGHPINPELLDPDFSWILKERMDTLTDH